MPTKIFRGVAPSAILAFAFFGNPQAATAQPDLNAVKTNNVMGTTPLVGGEAQFTWTTTVTNIGNASVVETFQTNFLHIDALPTNNISYGPVTIEYGGGTTGPTDSMGAPLAFCGAGNVSPPLVCTLGGSIVNGQQVNLEIPPSGFYRLSVAATATAAGTFDTANCIADLTGSTGDTNPANNTCFDPVVVTTGASGADLTVSKNNNVSSSTEIAAGAFTWSLAVSNGGSGAASFGSGDVILRDQLPSSNMTYAAPTLSGQSGVGGTGSISCGLSSSDLTCTASGGTVEIATTGSFTVNVDATPTAVGTFDNPRSGGTCAVNPDGAVSEDDLNNNSCSDSVSVAASPDLVMSKTNNVSGQGTVGQQFSWTVRVDNVGAGSAVFGALLPFLADALPNTNISYPGLSTNSSNFSGDSAACSINVNFILECTSTGTSTLASGGFFAVTISAVPTTVAAYTNPRSGGTCSADPFAQELETNELNNSCIADTVNVTTDSTSPDLTVAKNNSVTGSTELANGPFTWTFAVGNGGDTAAEFSAGDLILTDNLPNTNISYGTPTITGLVDVTGSGSIACSITAFNLNCSALGGTVILAGNTGALMVNVEATPSAAGTFQNPRPGGACLADPSGVVTEGDETNNTCADTVTVAASPDLTITKTNDTGGQGQIGVPFTWTVVVNNIGPGEFFVDLGLPLIVDNLPADDMTYGVPQVSSNGVSHQQIVCTLENANLICSPDNSGTSGIAPGGSVTVSFTATPSAAGDFDNPRAGGNCVADVVNRDLEIDETNNTCSDSVTVAAPDLTATKTNNTAGLTELAEQPFTWSIRVDNVGDEGAAFAAGDVILLDQLPDAGLTYATPSVGSTNGVSGTGTISCSLQTADLQCVADGGTVLIAAQTGSFTASVQTTPTDIGTFDNPRASGVCRTDPNDVLTEVSEANNDCLNAVDVLDSPDLTATKTNDANGSVSATVPFNWIIELENIGSADMNFPSGTIVLRDNLPNSDLSYGLPIVDWTIGPGGAISCTIDPQSDLECVATGAGATLVPSEVVKVTVPSTPATDGPFVNPRSGGVCTGDPDQADVELREDNNDCADTVQQVLFADGFESGDTLGWN